MPREPLLGQTIIKQRATMKRVLHFLQDTVHVMRQQFRLVFSDEGAILIIIGAVFIYSILYGAGYGKEVAEQIPIAIIDHSQTSESRALISNCAATPALHPQYYVCDIKATEPLFFDREIHGALYIPADYAERIQRREQATVGIYCDASYFLLYRQTFAGFVQAIDATSKEIASQRDFNRHTPQITYSSHSLFNPYLGYGTFVMPAILLLILQQTALIGIGLIIGTRREQYISLHAQILRPISPLASFTGEFLTYLLIYAATAAAIFSPYYTLMGYPIKGSTVACATIITLYLSAIILLAIAISRLLARREEPFVWLLWVSIPSLLVSGASLPTEAFPRPLYLIGQLLPSSSAIEAWARVQSMGASLTDVLPEIERLSILVIVYGIVAFYAVKRDIGVNS